MSYGNLLKKTTYIIAPALLALAAISGCTNDNNTGASPTPDASSSEKILTSDYVDLDYPEDRAEYCEGLNTVAEQLATKQRLDTNLIEQIKRLVPEDTKVKEATETRLKYTQEMIQENTLYGPTNQVKKYMEYMTAVQTTQNYCLPQMVPTPQTQPPISSQPQNTPPANNNGEPSKNQNPVFKPQYVAYCKNIDQVQSWIGMPAWSQEEFDKLKNSAPKTKQTSKDLKKLENILKTSYYGSAIEQKYQQETTTLINRLLEPCITHGSPGTTIDMDPSKNP